MFGLSPEEYKFLTDHLIEHLKKMGASVYIFGSRARGKHHKFSDVDMMYVENTSHSIDTLKISEILTFFEESTFPYKIDLVDKKCMAKSYLPKIELEKVEV